VLLGLGSAAEAAGEGVSGGVPVEVVPGPAVPPGGARVGVAGEVLHIPKRNAGVESRGD
jgi:hypothetical protein